MARHLDLGNCRDVARLGVGDDVPDLRLCVVLRLGPVAIHGPRLQSGQARALPDLDAPAFVVSEAPVKPVDLVLSRQIAQLLEVAHREKMSPATDQQSAMPDARVICDAKAGEL